MIPLSLYDIYMFQWRYLLGRAQIHYLHYYLDIASVTLNAIKPLYHEPLITESEREYSEQLRNLFRLTAYPTSTRRNALKLGVSRNWS